MRRCMIMILLVLMMFTGCSPASQLLLVEPVYPLQVDNDDFEMQRTLREKNALTESFVQSLDRFAYTSAASVFAENDGNVNYSPVSLYLALALTAEGAGSDTKDRLMEALQVQDMTLTELADQCGKLYRLLSIKENEIGRAKPSVSLWLNEGERLKPNFAKTAKEHFYAEVYSGDLESEPIRKMMGEWVRDKTSGQLTPSIEISKGTLMTLFTCLDFEDQWIDEFIKENNRKADFTRSDGSIMLAEYMCSSYNPYGYFRGEDYCRASLPMKNGSQVSFILPDEGVSAAELAVDPNRLEAAISGGEEAYAKIIFEIPKFDFSGSWDLKKTVADLGAGDVFDPDADLYGISGNQLYLTDIRQQTRVAVDEKGVSAAAFTQIAYAGGALPKQEEVYMILNRPFIYTIEDCNGVILFIGICETPAEA